MHAFANNSEVKVRSILTMATLKCEELHACLSPRYSSCMSLDLTRIISFSSGAAPSHTDADVLCMQPLHQGQAENRGDKADASGK
ncbi:hypothetical protein GUJ93_ZPchr0006g43984 [Zizania palustris]|uniref:Uncharacterized protein n=1 Tax=Zizania palustris TaxID=103762 RepID=A0A8J5W3C8_ZIZPA|nr:hypothetical protein GUJ93_ZPchr0006g43984 [Zizania palustris]